MINAINLIESEYAVTTAPAVVHKKRRGQSDAYHRRVQKKWNKRYGTTMKPAAYVIDGSAVGFLFGRRNAMFPAFIVAHPELAAVLRNVGHD